jgi:hypothetical protein
MGFLMRRARFHELLGTGTAIVRRVRCLSCFHREAAATLPHHGGSLVFCCFLVFATRDGTSFHSEACMAFYLDKAMLSMALG